MKVVYIAGPYTKPDPCENTYKAVCYANVLMDMGYAVFIPHLAHFQHTMHPRPYQDWIANDMEFVRRADALLRFPGESPGADGEVALAEELGIPVFYTVEDLAEYFKNEA
jgi:nucleoside 2-deoxyribosyltransferase